MNRLEWKWFLPRQFPSQETVSKTGAEGPCCYFGQIWLNELEADLEDIWLEASRLTYHAGPEFEIRMGVGSENDTFALGGLLWWGF